MDSFANRYRALLLMSQLIGILERMIKERLAAVTDQELFSLDRKLFYRAKELAQPETPRAISLGRFREVWFNHPFYNILLAEKIRRMPPDPPSTMTSEQIRAYLIQRSERQSYSPKERKKELPVLPQRKVNAK